jgi:hypothetical protein
LQDQPLLLEDLLEQEKREQELQQHAQSNLQQEPKLTSSVNNAAPTESSSSLLSDTDFEHLKADVLGSPATGQGGLMPHAKPGINDETNLPKSAFFGTLGSI